MGMVGNFVKGKDQLTICKALPTVFSEYPNARFLFVGHKPTQQPHYFEECYNYCINK